jgi:AcrR family transcriptional regulator
MPRNKTITDDEILTVARTLFLKEGVNASTRDIAKQAGISEAVIYQRFGTKEDFSEKLTDYLMGESKMGRVNKGNVAIAIDILLSYLHNLALYETIGVPKTEVEPAVADAITALWEGLAP